MTVNVKLQDEEQLTTIDIINTTIRLAEEALCKKPKYILLGFLEYHLLIKHLSDKYSYDYPTPVGIVEYKNIEVIIVPKDSFLSVSFGNIPDDLKCKELAHYSLTKYCSCGSFNNPNNFEVNK